MNNKYTIYLGRFKITQFQADDIYAATKRFDAIANEMKQTGTCTLYQGGRSIENMCTQMEISDRRHRANGGKSRWSGTTKAERADEMKRIRAFANTNGQTCRTNDTKS